MMPKKSLGKCVHAIRMPLTWQTESLQMKDLKRRDTVPLILMMLQTKYHINQTCKGTKSMKKIDRHADVCIYLQQK